jgi:hypothetical protein
MHTVLQTSTQHEYFLVASSMVKKFSIMSAAFQTKVVRAVFSKDILSDDAFAEVISALGLPAMAFIATTYIEKVAAEELDNGPTRVLQRIQRGLQLPSLVEWVPPPVGYRSAERANAPIVGVREWNADGIPEQWVVLKTDDDARIFKRHLHHDVGYKEAVSRVDGLYPKPFKAGDTLMVRIRRNPVPETYSRLYAEWLSGAMKAAAAPVAADEKQPPVRKAIQYMGQMEFTIMMALGKEKVFERISEQQKLNLVRVLFVHRDVTKADLAELAKEFDYPAIAAEVPQTCCGTCGSEFDKSTRSVGESAGMHIASMEDEGEPQAKSEKKESGMKDLAEMVFAFMSNHASWKEAKNIGALHQILKAKMEKVPSLSTLHAWLADPGATKHEKAKRQKPVYAALRALWKAK